MKEEIYISVDVEASGPIPGEYSMLALGACVVGDRSQTFYAEIKPLNENYVKRALEAAKLSMSDLKVRGVEAGAAMLSFEKWINDVCGDARPVFVGFNATFDWTFVNYYFHKFLGRNPFGISGLDIKAYYMGATGCGWGETVKRKVKAKLRIVTPHTHNALEDAIEQAEIFEAICKEREGMPK